MTQRFIPPTPPYYAAIFTSNHKSNSDDYNETADRMLDLASKQTGFLGVDSARSTDGFGITVSYWQSRQDIAHWKANAEHEIAQRLGREKWYSQYSLHIALVEETYSFESKQ